MFEQVKEFFFNHKRIEICQTERYVRQDNKKQENYRKNFNSQLMPPYIYDILIYTHLFFNVFSVFYL